MEPKSKAFSLFAQYVALTAAERAELAALIRGYDHKQAAVGPKSPRTKPKAPPKAAAAAA